MECKLSKTVSQSKIHYEKDACMNFYDEMKSLYLETNASGVGLRSGLFTNKRGYELS